MGQAAQSGPKLRDRIMEELSGRDEFDISLMLEGAPETPEQKLALAKRKQQYEHTAYALGGYFSTDERNSSTTRWISSSCR